MSMSQPHTPDGPVTVAELLLALASYPQDGTIEIADPHIGIGVLVGGEYYDFYEPAEGRPQHYEPPIVEIKEVPAPRHHAGDDYAAAQDVLEWLRQRGIGLVNPGQGHNETASPVLEAQRAQLARDFAARDRRSS